MPRATSSTSAKKAPAKKSPAKSAGSKTVTAKAAAPAKKATPPTKKATPVAKAPSKATSPNVTTAKKAAPAKSPAKKAAPAKVVAKKAAPAAAKKAAPAKRKLSATELKFIESQHELLLKERATYLRQADSLKAEADSLAELREPGDVQFDEESGEGDTLAVERERDLALSHQARAAVEEIDHALTKIDLGTYGICEVSGQPIPKERLKAIPWARERVEYKVGGFGRR
jgi:RNA polymerase-binding transcription factor DksA